MHVFKSIGLGNANSEQQSFNRKGLCYLWCITLQPYRERFSEKPAALQHACKRWGSQAKPDFADAAKTISLQRRFMPTNTLNRTDKSDACSTIIASDLPHANHNSLRTNQHSTSTAKRFNANLATHETG